MKTGLSAAVMKKTFLVLALTLFTTMLVPAIQADAYVIHYAVTGGTGDSWSGTFVVNSEMAEIRNTANISTITAYTTDINGVITNTYPTISPITNSYRMLNFGSWLAVWEGPGKQFIIGSDSLVAAINTGVRWYDIANETKSSTYTLNPSNSATYWTQGLADTLASLGGGQITFYVTPEPGTMMLLGSGVLTFGLSRFRRRKQEAGV